MGNPNQEYICTSYIERTNLTIRTFMRRFTRLALGFSKKLENLKSAIALFSFITISVGYPAQLE